MNTSINFPNLHIYLENVGKEIMIGNFSIKYYGMVIGLGMLAGIAIACWKAKHTGQNEEEYMDFVNQIKNMSVIDTDVDVEYGDKLLTLSGQ